MDESRPTGLACMSETRLLVSAVLLMQAGVVLTAVELAFSTRAELSLWWRLDHLNSQLDRVDL